MTALLTDNLPLLAGAPNGIKKLRELILELAVRGKLVPQDSNDEPASELLSRITEEKARLVAEGKIKKAKATHEDLAEISYDIPPTWAVASLGQVVEIVRGITFPASEKSKEPELGRIACLRTANVQDEIEWDDLLYIRESFVSRHDQYVEPHDIVMSMANSRELVGKVALIGAELKQKTTFGGFLGVLRPVLIEPRFIMALLRTPHARSALIDSASQTTNIANVSLGKLRPLPFAIPPLAEQHRIVAKVDELMALCDRLEAQQAGSESTHAQLVQALLDSLTQASDAADFAASWQRLAEHFHTLFTTESSIDALKQTLLQLAVMGKLVPQDSSDEPAAELLARLAKDRSEYASLHKVAVTKPEPISASDQSLPLPHGWEWTRLCSMFRLITDGDHQPPPKSTDGIAFLTIGNVTKGRLDFSSCRFVPQDYFNKIALYRRPEIGDILYTVVGATYGRPIAVNSSRDFCVQRHIAILKSSELLNSKFACYLLSSPWVYEQATQSTTGTAQPTIPLRPLRNFRVMLPPLPEQHRIVAKVDQLMALCDQLKTRITQARQLNEQLASTLVEQAVA